MQKGLEEIGFDVIACEGTYFIFCDFRPLIPRMGGFNGDDVEFCRRLTVEGGVTAVPVSAFYSRDPPQHFVRFSFCKEDATLDAAIDRMTAYFGERR